VDPGNIVQLTTVTAVKNIDRVDVGVAYPNPTSDLLNIQFKENIGAIDFSILDCEGS